jgi:hypothetical protein
MCPVASPLLRRDLSADQWVCPGRAGRLRRGSHRTRALRPARRTRPWTSSPASPGPARPGPGWPALHAARPRRLRGQQARHDPGPSQARPARDARHAPSRNAVSRGTRAASGPATEGPPWLRARARAAKSGTIAAVCRPALRPADSSPGPRGKPGRPAQSRALPSPGPMAGPAWPTPGRPAQSGAGRGPGRAYESSPQHVPLPAARSRGPSHDGIFYCAAGGHVTAAT